MEKLDVMDASGEAVSWIVRNQDILLGYAVNLVAAVVIIIIGGYRCTDDFWCAE